MNDIEEYELGWSDGYAEGKRYADKEIDACEAVYINGYEQVAKDYKEQRDLLFQENAELFGKIEQLTKERDAAVADLKTVCDYFGECVFCKLYQNGKCSSDEYRIICSKNNSKWEWRGIDEN